VFGGTKEKKYWGDDVVKRERPKGPVAQTEKGD
jgi:hypothetical protein